MNFGKPWTPKAEKYWRQAKHDLCVEHDDIFFWGAPTIVPNISYLLNNITSVQMSDIEKDFEARYNSLNIVPVKDLIPCSKHTEIAKLLVEAMRKDVVIINDLKTATLSIVHFLHETHG